MPDVMPKRIQRRRTKGAKLPPNTKCCTRPGPFSNPFIGTDAAEWFRYWLIDFPSCPTVNLVRAARLVGADVYLHVNADPIDTAQRLRNDMQLLRRYDYLE